MDEHNKLLMKEQEKLVPSSGEVHIIKERCKECDFCIEFCPRGVLKKSEETNEKGYHPPKLVEGEAPEEICAACRFCERICPEFAIWVESKEKAGERRRYKILKDFSQLRG